jgi:hypothetical protein
MALGQEMAETIAIRALAWIASEDDLWPMFLAAGGLGPADVRARTAEPEFLASVLDFILMEDGWIVRFCDAAGLDYDRPLAARRSLPGGQVVDWT